MDQIGKDNCYRIWFKCKMDQNNLKVPNDKEDSLESQAPQTK